MKKSILSACAIAVTGCMAMLSQTAQAEPTGYNQISFNVEASTAVENDEVTATLYKQAQASTPKQLAIELNNTINQAIKTAKSYPSVTVTTGSQNSYPKYDKDQEIVGWTGSVAVNLKSDDFAATSELIANLQETLVMQNIQFGISKEKRDAIEKELMIKASQAFKDQAQTLTKAWDFSGYQIVSVSLNTNGGYMPRPMMMSAVSRDASPAMQNLEGGDSEVKVTANGTIELIPWMQ